MRRWLAVIPLVLLVGCINYSGEGNEFVLTGRVVEVGDESVKVRIDQIETALGEASGWFTQGAEHRIHDNRSDGWNRDKIGKVYSATDERQNLSAVHVGMVVRVEGRIRHHKQGKAHHYRPVFDALRLPPS